MVNDCKFCIKHVNVEFRKITDDQYSLIDLSEYEYNDIDDIRDQIITFKIDTPTRETIEVMVPAGRSQIFSLKGKNIIPFVDGKYCVSCVSCGVPIKKNIGYYPNMSCDIDNIVVKTKDLKLHIELTSSFKLMQILDEYGDSTSADRIYGDLSDMLKGCRSDKKCLG